MSVTGNERDPYRVVWGRQRFRLSVGWKTLIAFALVLFVPMAGVLAVSTDALRKALTEESVQGLEDSLRGGWRMLGERLASARELLEFAADDPALQVRAGPVPDQDALRIQLERKARQLPTIDLWFALGPDGRVLARPGGLPGGRIPLDAVLSRVASGGQSVVTTQRFRGALLAREDRDRYGDLPDDVLVQLVAVPVRGRGQLQAVLIGLVLLDQRSWLPDLLWEELGVEAALLRAGHGSMRVAAATGRSDPFWRQGHRIATEMQQTLLEGRSFRGRVKLNQSPVLMVVDPILDLDGEVIGALAMGVPAASLERLIREHSRYIWGFTLLGLLLAVPVALLAYRDTMAPIRAITRAMHAFAGGDLEVRTRIRTQDEFEQLGSGFNQMATAIAEHRHRMERFNALTSLLIAQDEPEALLSRVLDEIIRLTAADVGVFYLVEREQYQPALKFRPRVAYGIDLAGLNTLHCGEGLVGEAARQQRTLLAQPPVEAPPMVIDYGCGRVLPRELMAIPVVYQQQVQAVLLLGAAQPFDGAERSLLDYVANQIAIFLENAHVHARLQTLSITDELTGLLNRRHMLVRLREECARASRTGSPVAVLLLDVDHFKRINDRHGHAVGDRVLQQVARALRQNLRESDLCGRYGGEEFLVALPDTDPDAAVRVAEKLRRAAGQVAVVDQSDEMVTVSIGVAAGRERPDTLIDLADQRMYRAKRGGRDQVVADGAASSASPRARTVP